MWKSLMRRRNERIGRTNQARKFVEIDYTREHRRKELHMKATGLEYIKQITNDQICEKL